MGCRLETQPAARFAEKRRDHPNTPHDDASRDDRNLEKGLAATGAWPALRCASAEHTGANEVAMKLVKMSDLSSSVPSFETFGTTHMGPLAHGCAHRGDEAGGRCRPAHRTVVPGTRCVDDAPSLTKMRPSSSAREFLRRVSSRCHLFGFPPTLSLHRACEGSHYNCIHPPMGELSFHWDLLILSSPHTNCSTAAGDDTSHANTTCLHERC
ncbi:hypothetical protein EI94DRAFT_1290336 [Lactarius quietus]|nr:hypothetical protein EI94DRAFT_1290336 [Lactarius quietus]